MKNKVNIPTWNKDKVWKNVESRLQRDKKKGLLLYYFYGTSLLLLIGFIAWDNLFQVHESNAASIGNAQENVEIDIAHTQNSPVNKIAKDNKPISISPLKGPERQQESKSRLSPIIKQADYQAHSKNIIYKNIITLRETKQAVLESINRKSGHQAIQALPIYPSLVYNPPFKDNLGSKQSSIVVETNESLPTCSWWLESGVSFQMQIFPRKMQLNESGLGSFPIRFIQTSALGLNKQLGRRSFIKFGIAYQTIFEKFESSFFQLAGDKEVFSENAIIYNLSNGLTYSEPGLATQRTFNKRNIIHNNFTHRLSIPIEFAYSLHKNNWTLEPSLGIRFQFYERFDGILANNGSPLFDIEEINNKYYSNDSRLGLIARLNLRYSLNVKNNLALKITYEKDDFINLTKSRLLSRFETAGVILEYSQNF